MFDYIFQINPDSMLIIFNFMDSNFTNQDFELKQTETKLFSVKDSQKISIVKKTLCFTILNDYFDRDQKDLMENAQKLFL